MDEAKEGRASAKSSRYADVRIRGTRKRWETLVRFSVVIFAVGRGQTVTTGDGDTYELVYPICRIDSN